MSLLGRGSIGGHPVAPSPAQLAAMRVAAARKNPHWTEIEDDLVARKPRYLVSASTDIAYRVYRGATFAGGQLAFDAERPHPFVIRDGDVLVLEEIGVWSEMFARRQPAAEQSQPKPRRRRVRAR